MALLIASWSALNRCNVTEWSANNDNASVAQQVEQRFCKPQVVGSSPTASFCDCSSRAERWIQRGQRCGFESRLPHFGPIDPILAQLALLA